MTREEQLEALFAHLSEPARLKAMEDAIKGGFADREDAKIIRRLYLDATEPKGRIAA